MKHHEFHRNQLISQMSFGVAVLLIAGVLGLVQSTRATPSGLAPYAYLPIVRSSGCAPIAAQTYDTLAPTNPRGDDPKNDHLINLGRRGYEVVDKDKNLMGNPGNPNDPLAPQFPTLFSPERLPSFSAVYALHRWDDTCDCQSPELVTNPEVTVVGLATTPDEIIHTPDSGYEIGPNRDALVLYAEATRVVLKYTREDDIVSGYTVYLENVCIEPSLLALYQQMHTAGRSELPALAGGQPLGRAIDDEIGVAVRDSGSSQDPRSRNSWWLGY
jgi:hypothetical protein